MKSTASRSRRVSRQSPIVRYFKRGQLGRSADENTALFSVARQYAVVAAAAHEANSPAQSNYDERITAAVGDLHRLEALTEAKSAFSKVNRHLGATLASVCRSVCLIGYSAEVWAEMRGHERTGIGLAFLVEALRELRTLDAQTSLFRNIPD